MKGFRQRKMTVSTVFSNTRETEAEKREGGRERERTREREREGETARERERVRERERFKRFKKKNSKEKS